MSLESEERKKATKRLYYLKNRARFLAAAKARYLKNGDKLRAATRAHYRKNKEACLAYTAGWVASNKDKRRAILRKYNANNKEKLKAREVFNNSIQYKTVKKVCTICGKGRAQAHHSDYSKPLEIIWFCTKHHSAWHRVFIAENA